MFAIVPVLLTTPSHTCTSIKSQAVNSGTPQNLNEMGSSQKSRTSNRSSSTQQLLFATLLALFFFVLFKPSNPKGWQLNIPTRLGVHTHTSTLHTEHSIQIHKLPSKTLANAYKRQVSLVKGRGTYNLDSKTGPHEGRQGWSQYGQDDYVDKLLRQKRDGFFIELGGYNGESHSNTLFFEKYRGWDGLLIEANPFTFEQMVAKDRNCCMINACVSRDVPSMEFLIAGGITSAVDVMSQEHKHRIQSEMGRYGKLKQWEGVGKTVRTQCHTLSAILNEVGTLHVDYFSLDVEGAEMFILKSLDWDKLFIDVFTIEVQTNRQKIHDFMISKGYERIGTVSIDDVYRKKVVPSTSIAAPMPELALVKGKGTYKLDSKTGPHAGRQGWSQYGQDDYVDKLLKQKRDGFFIELGGYNGESHSNTLFFEKYRGWDGLLIEANPYTFDQMVAKDRNCYMINACVSRDVPSMEFLIAGGITSAVDVMSQQHKHRIQSEMGRYGKLKQWEGVGKTVRTQCHTLSAILNKVGTLHVDYFSLDVEGAEMFILKSLDWDKLFVDIFTIEVQANRQEIHDFMISKGYERIGTVSIDDVYRKKAAPFTTIAAPKPKLSLVKGKASYKLAAMTGPHADRQGWSQYGQDDYVDKLLKQKRNGFFIELGGYDGESHSNTLFFEKHRGWDGLLIEANPYTFDQMVVKDRNCYMINACVSRDVPSMEFLIAGGITSAVDVMSKQHKSRIQSDSSRYGKLKQWEGVGKTVRTQCHTLSAILNEVGTLHVDYFSLDVEGAEMFILKSLDWDKLSIDVFTIEVQSRRQEIHDFMVSKGYERIGTVSIDDVYRKRPANLR